MNSVELAHSVANQAHKGQTRKGTSIAYILHPMEAGTLAHSMLSQLNRYDENVISASILHDVLEDTELTEEHLNEQFNDRIVELVKCQSEDKALSWEQRKQETINLLNNTSDIDVKIVHLADKLSNMRSIYKDYKSLGDKLWERFNENDVEKQKWYYKSIGESMSELEGLSELSEYNKLVKKVFG